MKYKHRIEYLKTPYLPGSKLGEAMGDNSTLTNRTPSVGRLAFG